MTVTNELIDSLLANYKKPEDLIGENGLLAPSADEVGHAAVATAVTLRLDLCEQRFGHTPAVFGAMGINHESLFQRWLKGSEYANGTFPVVLGQDVAWRLEPFLDRIA
jgi:putative transposase